MADPVFHAEVVRRRGDPHVAPINALVDALARERGLPVPAVPAHCGGVDARVLTLLSNPGPGSCGPRGSGFVSSENVAPSAVRLGAAYAAAGLPEAEVVPWNAVPWYEHDVHRGRLTAARRAEGTEPLRRLLELLPRLRAVVLHGRDARDGWARLLRAHPGAAARGLVALPTWHPSGQVFAVPPAVRAQRERELVDACVAARELLGGPGPG